MIEQVKQLVTSAPLLKYFRRQRRLSFSVMLHAEKGLGAILTRDGHRVAYGSGALTETESRYAQIEKEIFAIIYGLEKFHTYTYGRKLSIEYDHQPLEVLLRKPLYKAP